MTGAETSASQLYEVKDGDFIYSRLFAWRGAFGLIGPNLAGAYVSSEFPTFRVDEQRLDPRFLNYWFRIPDTLRRVEADCTGSTPLTRNRFKETFFLNLEIALPSVGQQRRIVERIEAIAGKVEQARRLRGEADKETEVLWERTAAEIYDQAVENAPLRALADVVEVRGGGTPSKSNPFYWEGRIPWVSPKDMKFREIHDSLDHVSEAATSETAAKLLEPGAVLIVVRGMILAHTVPSAVLRVPAAINQDMKALVPGPDLLPEYLSGLFWAYNERLLKLVEKSTHDTRKLQTARLLDTKIPIPSINLQQRIVDDLANLEVKVSELAKQQLSSDVAIDVVMAAVLDRAFRGAL